MLLFATELELQLNPGTPNTQLDSYVPYVSYRLDPGTSVLDIALYAFLPFALLPKVLQKISLDQDTSYFHPILPCIGFLLICFTYPILT